MSEVLNTRFRDHQVHGLILGALNLLGEIRANQPVDEPTAEYLDAIGATLERVQGILAAQDPRFVSSRVLDLLGNRAQDASNRVDGVRSDPTEPPAREALEAALGVLEEAIARFPTRLPAADEVAVGAVTDAIRNETQGIIQGLRESTQALADGITAQATTASEILNSVSAQAAEHSTTITNAATEATNEMSSVRNSIQQQVANFEATTAQLEQQRAAALTQINEALSGMESRFANATTSREETFKAAMEDAAAQNAALLQEIEATHARADEVLKLAGGAALSARWIKQARAQFIERLVWLAAIGIAAYTALSLGFKNLHSLTAPEGATIVGALVFYAPRIPLAVISITVIGFMIQQAARRALWEARDRRVANELTAFPSFIKSIPEEAATELSKRVADRYFPGPELSHDEPKPEPEQQPRRIDRALLTALSSAGALGVALMIALLKS